MLLFLLFFPTPTYIANIDGGLSFSLSFLCDEVFLRFFHRLRSYGGFTLFLCPANEVNCQSENPEYNGENQENIPRFVFKFPVRICDQSYVEKKKKNIACPENHRFVICPGNG
jgi:hypothetical protein